jgi:predicted  nucleic acid-binding Zn-ribbon protein
MTKPTEKITICALCEERLELNSQILLNGCPYCGSFKFKTFKEMSTDQKKEEELDLIVEKEIHQTDIKDGLEAIRLTSEGVFEVDIEKLLTEDDDSKPIISRNKDGSYYIKFQTEED